MSTAEGETKAYLAVLKRVLKKLPATSDDEGSDDDE